MKSVGQEQIAQFGILSPGAPAGHPENVMTYQADANTGLGTLVDLSDYPTNKQLASALSDKVDKVNGKGLSTNDFTDEYKDALDDMMENGSAFSTGENVGDVGITDEATQDSEDLITSGAVYSMMNAISSGAGVSASASSSVIFFFLITLLRIVVSISF